MALKYNKNNGYGYIDIEIDTFTEHKGKKYYIYFKGMNREKSYMEFIKRWNMEEFLYDNGILNFEYKSSNGKVYKKKWEYIEEKLEEYRKYSWHKTGDEYNWYTGHYIGDK